ncbi:MAG: cellulase family glycosylhydrolase [Verrucomicrobiota bacterium]
MNAETPRRFGPAKIAFACLMLGLAAAQAAPLQLHVDGNKVRDSNNNIVRLQGANIPSLEWSNNGEHIVDSQTHLRDVWNANFIRFPLSQDRWFGHAPGQSDGGAAYRAIVDGIVARANAGDYYVLLDLHWSNRGTWGSNIGQAAMPDMNSATFWSDCADRYKNNPSVLFDLYNEPYLGNWQIWRNGGQVTQGSVTYQSPGMQGLLDAVRATGANNIVVAGGIAYGYDLTGVMNGYALTDTSSGRGIIYSSHVYPWKTDRDAKVTVAAAAHPILIGECGADDNPEPHGGGTPLDAQGVLDWSNNHIAWMNANGYHWTGWSFHPGAGPKMVSDWNYTPTPWGQIAKNQIMTATLPPQTGGTTVQLAASDVWEQTSFNTATNWTGGQAPHSGATYVVDGLDLRTPGNTSSHTFQGAALLAMDGGRLVMRTNVPGVVTIGAMHADAATISLAKPGAFTLAGNLAVQAGGLTVSSGTPGRTLMITSRIEGPGALTVNMANATDHTTLTNAANLHSGGNVVATGTLRVQANGALGSGEVVVAPAATLHLDYTGPDTVAALSLDGGATYVMPGEWGSVGSGAANTSARLTGTGRLQVTGGGPTTYVQLAANDEWEQTSFSTGVNWTGGQTPQSGATYVVDGRDLRTPGNTSSHTFQGDALLVMDAGRLIMRTNVPGVVTVGAMHADAATISLAKPGAFTLAGNLTVQAGGLTVSSGTANRTLTITSQIGGPGALTVSMANATDHTTLTNASNTYAGGTTVSTGTLRAQAIGALGSGAVVVAGTATLNLDYSGTATVPALSLNGGTSNVTPGEWGAIGSGAANTSARLTGTGRLQVVGN